ncbi:hypothetical protein Adt_10847 [Abeliophyllum distichum]|uniref:Uncharacterized protein n=1 Tax=Abeliophyllum distichum TaxID=126358 RepID=A0ABD1UL51_9LAMI
MSKLLGEQYHNTQISFFGRRIVSHYTDLKIANSSLIQSMHPVHRSLNRSGRLGQRNGGGSGNVVRSDGAGAGVGTGGGDDGGFGLAKKLLNGLPCRSDGQVPSSAEHSSGAQSWYSHTAAMTTDFSVPVLGGQRRPISSS